jgi:predicted PurR-regulated permease PerM
MPLSSRTSVLPLAIVATVLVGWVLDVGEAIVKPLFVALFLVGILSPVVRALARLRVPPVLSVLGMAALLFWGTFQGLQYAQVNVLAFIGEGRENAPLVEAEEAIAPAEAPALEALVASIQLRVTEWSLPPSVKNVLRTELDDVVASGRLEVLANEFLSSGLAFLQAALLVLVYMLFIFAEQAVFRRKLLAVAGERREETARALDTIGRGVQRFVGIRTLTSLATGAAAYALLVALDVPYALPFAIITFLLNYIPYFGSIVAGALPTVTALAVGESWHTAALVAAAYAVINVVIGSFVEPKIMGRELDLSPLVLIVAVVFWTTLWGVVGALLAVPIMATLQIVLASNDTTRSLAVLLSSGPPKEPARKTPRAIA